MRSRKLLKRKNEAEMYYPELTQTKSSFESISSKAGWLRGIDKEGMGVQWLRPWPRIKSGVKELFAGCTEQPHPAQLCPRETVRHRCVPAHGPLGCTTVNSTRCPWRCEENQLPGTPGPALWPKRTELSFRFREG